MRNWKISQEDYNLLTSMSMSVRVVHDGIVVTHMHGKKCAKITTNINLEDRDVVSVTPSVVNFSEKDKGLFIKAIHQLERKPKISIVVDDTVKSAIYNNNSFSLQETADDTTLSTFFQAMPLASINPIVRVTSDEWKKILMLKTNHLHWENQMLEDVPIAEFNDEDYPASTVIYLPSEITKLLSPKITSIDVIFGEFQGVKWYELWTGRVSLFYAETLDNK